jgi:hypothetical protein
MKRRHQRRTTLTVLVALSLLASVFVSATPAVAMPQIAGIGRVSTGGIPLNARSGPTTSNTKTGEIRNRTYVSIVCHVVGQYVVGNVRTTRVWDMLPNYSFVSDAYVARPYYKIPLCHALISNGAWMLPVLGPLSSGFRTLTRPGHDGVDIAAARNTPIHAAAAGRVIKVTCQTPSNNCDVDGGLGVGGCGWYVEVQHRGYIVTRYCHMVHRPSVNVGQAVRRGTVLGFVGMSGNASGPHLHFEVHAYSPPATHANAYNPIIFMRAHGLVFH